ERSVFANPLTRYAKASDVDEVLDEKLLRARRPKRTVGLRDVAIRPDHRLRDRVAQQPAMHRAASDFFEDEVIRTPAKDRLAFVVHQVLARFSDAENLADHRDLFERTVAKPFRVIRSADEETERDRCEDCRRMFALDQTRGELDRE